MTSYSFPSTERIHNLSAKMLLEIGAIHFMKEKPFTLTSGWASPVYVDCRKIISYPKVRRTLMDFATATILESIGFAKLDAVAGGETAGIPFAAWLADKLDLPMQYVRKQPKGFGRNAQIEGDLKEGSEVLLVEDLTTDGQSKLRFCEALRQAGATVEHTLVVFYYGVFQDTEALLRQHGITLHALATWHDVLQTMGSYGSTEDRQRLERYLSDPINWSEQHGGRGPEKP